MVDISSNFEEDTDLVTASFEVDTNQGDFNIGQVDSTDLKADISWEEVVDITIDFAINQEEVVDISFSQEVVIDIAIDFVINFEEVIDISFIAKLDQIARNCIFAKFVIKLKVECITITIAKEETAITYFAYFAYFVN